MTVAQSQLSAMDALNALNTLQDEGMLSQDEYRQKLAQIVEKSVKRPAGAGAIKICFVRCVKLRCTAPAGAVPPPEKKMRVEPKLPKEMKLKPAPVEKPGIQCAKRDKQAGSLFALHGFTHHIKKGGALIEAAVVIKEKVPQFSCFECLDKFDNPGSLATHRLSHRKKHDGAGDGPLLKYWKIRVDEDLRFHPDLSAADADSDDDVAASDADDADGDVDMAAEVKAKPRARKRNKSSVDGRQNNRGAASRKNWSYAFKARAIDLYDAAVEEGIPNAQKEVLAIVGCSAASLSRWINAERVSVVVRSIAELMHCFTGKHSEARRW